MVNDERSPALLQKMKALRSSLSKSERKAIDFIIQNPEKVIYLSVAGLAEGSGVSDATVIRACRRIGLDRYQDLKVTLAQDIVSPLQSIHEEINASDDTATIVSKLFDSTLHAIQFTYNTLKISSLESASEAIMSARTVTIIGLGNSHAIALDLQHKLLRLGIRSTAYTDGHLQAIAVSFLTSEDVLFSISHSGSSRDIVENTQTAKTNGAKTISLTNIGVSPLSKITDIQLYTASSETKFHIVAMSSRIAQMTIIDALYTIIAVKRPGATDGFRRIDKAMSKLKY
ncbi:MAG: MurR/RpiR family transcriptional regulator [Negativicutes bacterium]